MHASVALTGEAGRQMHSQCRLHTMLQRMPAPVRVAAQASGRARLHSGCSRRAGAARRVVGAHVVAAASADGGEDLYAMLGVDRSADSASSGSTACPVCHAAPPLRA